MIDQEIQIYEGSSPGSSSELPEEVLIVLVQQARGQDKAAFAALYQFYYPRICRYLAGLVASPEVGEDLAQETFLRVWSKLPNLINERNFIGWLYRIAKNLLLDYLRSKRRERPPLENIEDADTRIAFENDIEERELVRLALEQISPKRREVLFLHLENYSYAEIATMSGIQRASVATYISEGRRQFHRIYSQLTNEEEPIQTATPPQRPKSLNYSKQRSYSEATSQPTQTIIAVEADTNQDKSGKETFDRREEQQGIENEPHEQPILKEEHTKVPPELVVQISSLPESYRKTLHLSLVEHLSNQQIATQLGLPLGTVKSHLSRGKKLLFGIKQSQTREDNITDLQTEQRRRSPDKVIPSFVNPFLIPEETQPDSLEFEGTPDIHECLAQLPGSVESQVAPLLALPMTSHKETLPLRRSASYRYHSEDYNEHAVNTTDAGESDVLKTYLLEISHIPTITHEREIELAQRIETGDLEARNQFILSN